MNEYIYATDSNIRFHNLRALTFMYHFNFKYKAGAFYHKVGLKVFMMFMFM
jgi:hypothetical protein